MANKAKILEAVRGITSATRAGLAWNGKTFKAQENRESKAAKKLLVLMGIEKPTQEECDYCYPW